MMARHNGMNSSTDSTSDAYNRAFHPEEYTSRIAF